MIKGTVTSQGTYADGKDICEIYMEKDCSPYLPHEYRKKKPITLIIGHSSFTAGVHETKEGVLWISSVLEKGGTKFRLVDELKKIEVKKGYKIILKEIEKLKVYEIVGKNTANKNIGRGV